mmetsp:Transcript_10629/g.23368  ORF Transcript_10629/g.23368 Transcript_10629/m.23368 type:complete len:161 (+) Transcript_10629:3616-4098(+)
MFNLGHQYIKLSIRHTGQVWASRHLEGLVKLFDINVSTINGRTRDINRVLKTSWFGSFFSAAPTSPSLLPVDPPPIVPLSLLPPIVGPPPIIPPPLSPRSTLSTTLSSTTNLSSTATITAASFHGTKATILLIPMLIQSNVQMHSHQGSNRDDTCGVNGT